jgi:hypothetical protein
LLTFGCAARGPSVKFHATPSSIGSGKHDQHDAKLTWTSKGVTGLVITPEIGEVYQQGSVMVAPRTTTVYTLTATGLSGKSVKKVKVRRKP